jgi:beta-glucosidase
VSLEVANTGDRPGTDVPQIYVTLPGRRAPRLAGWGRIRLEPGAAGRVEVALERRVLADWDVTLPGWRNAEGTYRLAVGRDAQSPVLACAFELGPFRTSGASPAPGR